MLSRYRKYYLTNTTLGRLQSSPATMKVFKEDTHTYFHDVSNRAFCLPTCINYAWHLIASAEVVGFFVPFLFLLRRLAYAYVACELACIHKIKNHKKKKEPSLHMLVMWHASENFVQQAFLRFHKIILYPRHFQHMHVRNCRTTIYNYVIIILLSLESSTLGGKVVWRLTSTIQIWMTKTPYTY